MLAEALHAEVEAYIAAHAAERDATAAGWPHGPPAAGGADQRGAVGHARQRLRTRRSDAACCTSRPGGPCPRWGSSWARHQRRDYLEVSSPSPRAGDDRSAPMAESSSPRMLPSRRRGLARDCAPGCAPRGRGRRRAGALERAAAGLPAGRREGRRWFHKIRGRACRAAQVRPPRREEGPRGDLERRGQAARPRRGAGVRGRLRREVPKAAAKITDDVDELLAFYDYPAEHWVHLRTTNPIESTFATVRHRTKVTKGPGSRAAGLAMAFELIESAQDRWRAVNAPHLVALVRAGATFINGKLVERPGERSGRRSLKDLDPQVLTIAHGPVTVTQRSSVYRHRRPIPSVTAEETGEFLAGVGAGLPEDGFDVIVGGIPGDVQGAGDLRRRAAIK